ncbi:MAG: HEAT repeat domain-containing protein [Acidobacteria bacterium]|nr:HEAT repeat domain-containing protein [Acidobacteriota bacterium]
MTMHAIAEVFRQIVIVVLVVGGSILAVLLGFLVGLRGVREIRFQYRDRLKQTYRPVVQPLLHLDPPKDAFFALIQAPRRHRDVIGELLLAPLRVANGAFVGNLRTAAAALGLIDRWLADLAHRKWWIRSEAARALGLIQEPDAVEPLIQALDDDHEEVRAAAVEALGSIADARAIVPLLERLAHPARYPEARVIMALRSFGDPVTPVLLAYARQHAGDRATLANLLEMVGGAAAGDDLIAWCQDERPDVRAAALRALGTIGIDDRAYACATRALSEDEPGVRAMAARALGRSHRQDAARLLGDRLGDEWVVAAHAATALRGLGAAGAAQLTARSRDDGQAGDLARQMLWETQLQETPVAAGGAA